MPRLVSLRPVRRPSPTGGPRARAAGRALLAALLCLTVAACGHTRPERPDIVIYLCDTLRADHLGAYGYDRATSPSIDALADDSIVFENALAPSSWTKASTASLLTGLYPTQHNANDRDTRLPASVQLLSERLKELGYYNAGIITNPFVSNTFGFERGYDDFAYVGRAIAANLLQRVGKALDARPKDKPLFLYVHSIDPHAPYDPPPPFKQSFSKTPKIGNPDRLTADTPAQEIASIIDSYDSEILYHDTQFGKLVERLKQEDIYDDCMFWFVSDHGDEFAEHGRGGHGRALFGESLHVPMILKLPGNESAGVRVSALSSLIDVVPTLMGYMGQFPPEESAGLDLLVDLETRTSRPPLFLHLDLMVEQLFVSSGVVKGKYKFVEEKLPLQRKFLFDLESDPKEQVNLIDQLPDIAAELALLIQIHEQNRRSGITLRMVGEGNTRVRAVLSTTGRFENVDLFELEPGDTALIDESKQELTLDVSLVEFTSDIGALTTSDIDSFTLHLDPPDADVTVESLEVEGGEQDFPLFLGLKRERAELPYVLNVESPKLETKDIGLLFQKERNQAGSDFRGDAKEVPQPDPGMYVVALDAIDREEISELSEDDRKQLEELGYLGHEPEEPTEE